MSHWFLGIDAGGTKTAAVLLDADGQERGRGEGGAGNVAVQTDAVLRRSLSDALSGACQSAGISLAATPFTAVCAGVAGYSVEARRHAFQAILQELTDARLYRIEPDYLVAYWGATEGEPGIVVIAGTGAVSFGRNEQGEEYKEDGLGYLLGDRGSGFDLGLRVVRDTLFAVQTNDVDELTEAVLEFTHCRTQSELMQWLYRDFSPARVASLAPLIGKFAEQGNEMARHYVVSMVARLRFSARKVRHELLLPRNVPIYPMGGLWQLGDWFRAEFEEPTMTNADDDNSPPLVRDRFVLATPRHDPATGAALLARHTFWSDER